MQRRHARGLLPAEPQGLGKLGMFPAPLGDGIQAPGAAQHGAHRQGQNRRQGMAHSLGLPGVLYLAQGIQQSRPPVSNTTLLSTTENSDPNYSTLPRPFLQLKDPGGRGAPNATPKAVAYDVVHLAGTRYSGANHTHLSELLNEREGIDIGRTTLRRILVNAGLKSPRRRRPPKHRVRRQRMPRQGMLIQMDGSYHRCP